MENDCRVSVLSGNSFEEAYKKNNYLIENSRYNSNICAIYFSSSGIYFPNTEEKFAEAFIKNDKYEWYENRYLPASKHIFVRDIAKQFYIIGINDTLDTVDKLLALLHRETKGYRVITIGSSAGAYMATLAGIQLKAEFILCFSGYFNLNILDTTVWPYIKKYREDARSKWFDIVNQIESFEGIIGYFYPNDNEEDRQQSEQLVDVRNQGLYVFSCESDRHGIPFSKVVLKRLFTLDIENLKDVMHELYRIVTNRTSSDCLNVINKYRDVIVWGTGTDGKKTLSKINGLDVSNIIVWDSDANKWGTEKEGHKISEPKVVNEKSIIIISSYKYEEEIHRLIREHNNYGCDVVFAEDLFCPCCWELKKILDQRVS